MRGGCWRSVEEMRRECWGGGEGLLKGVVRGVGETVKACRTFGVCEKKV